VISYQLVRFLVVFTYLFFQGLVWQSLRNGNVLNFFNAFLLNFWPSKKIYANTMHCSSILFRIKILQSLIKANFQNAGSYLVVWCHFNHTWCHLVKTNIALNINQFYGLLLNPWKHSILWTFCFLKSSRPFLTNNWFPNYKNLNVIL